MIFRIMEFRSTGRLSHRTLSVPSIARLLPNSCFRCTTFSPLLSLQTGEFRARFNSSQPFLCSASAGPVLGAGCGGREDGTTQKRSMICRRCTRADQIFAGVTAKLGTPLIRGGRRRAGRTTFAPMDISTDPVFCPIPPLAALAFADDAFPNEGIRAPTGHSDPELKTLTKAISGCHRRPEPWIP